MKHFHNILLDGAANIWEAILKHPFLLQTADGSVSNDTFKTWMQQDYIFVREAIPFVSILLAKCPLFLRKNFIQIITGLDQELEMFEKNAREKGIDLTSVQAAPKCHAYIQFLMNTAYNLSFEEGFTVLYAAEKAYLDSWMVVKNNLVSDSPWKEFINNWTSDAFQQYVKWLAETLDSLIAGKNENHLQQLHDIFKLTGRYELLFWDMALENETWEV
jgi:thiaminase